VAVRERDQSVNNICIFSNEGEILNLVPLGGPLGCYVVHLEFLANELLLVLFNQGQEWLVDPNTTRTAKHHLIGLLEQ
jgi:hypothetical protein